MVTNEQSAGATAVTADPRRVDHTGHRFGQLLVLRYAGRVRVGSRTRPSWLCQCDCGNTAQVAGPQLTSGRTRSCGCLQPRRVAELRTTHGHTRSRQATPEYRVWCHMRDRCENPTARGYKNYGGRGITVCKRWQNFANFIADMGSRPTDLHTIERRYNNRNYTPSNCVWATRSVQNRNTRRTRVVRVSGQLHKVIDLAEQHGVNSRTVRKRLDRGEAIAQARR